VFMVVLRTHYVYVLTWIMEWAIAFHPSASAIATKTQHFLCR
jgi:hypothetical protein